MELMLITGLSGAGKTSALHALEDNGFYCVDNIPPVMIPDLVTSLDNYREKQKAEERGSVLKIAVVTDVRVMNFEGILTALDKLRMIGYKYKVVFLDATDEALDRRFKFTRRAHPLAKNGGTAEGIKKERQLLEPVRARADLIIDTTNYTDKQLKSRVVEFIHSDKGNQIFIMTFGFKKGTPIDLDMLFDVRFLRNPFYVEELKQLTGLDKRVRDYVFDDAHAEKYTGQAAALIDSFFPVYAKEVKNYLSVGVGCTGGHHRSVSVAEDLASRLREKGHKVHVEHRDISK